MKRREIRANRVRSQHPAGRAGCGGGRRICPPHLSLFQSTPPAFQTSFPRSHIRKDPLPGRWSPGRGARRLQLPGWSRLPGAPDLRREGARSSSPLARLDLQRHRASPSPERVRRWIRSGTTVMLHPRHRLVQPFSFPWNQPRQNQDRFLPGVLLHGPVEVRRLRVLVRPTPRCRPGKASLEALGPHDELPQEDQPVSRLPVRQGKPSPSLRRRIRGGWMIGLVGGGGQHLLGDWRGPAVPNFCIRAVVGQRSSSELMKVLNPSSIQAYRRSSLPTIIGNQDVP